MTEYIKSQGRRPRRHQVWMAQLLAGDAALSSPANARGGALGRLAPPAPQAERRSGARGPVVPPKDAGKP